MSNAAAHFELSYKLNLNLLFRQKFTTKKIEQSLVSV